MTRLPDYDEKEGLPEDSHREIRVHDTRYSADDEMGFLASQAAQIAVQEGSADIGSAIAAEHICLAVAVQGLGS